MVKESTNTFVYGCFTWMAKKATQRRQSAMKKLLWQPGDRIAIEILREYSATEFIGKMYWSTTGDWTPVDAVRVATCDWYEWYQKTAGRKLYFEMEGSGNWEVLHFRNESDASGPYVAVALKSHPGKLGWQ